MVTAGATISCSDVMVSCTSSPTLAKCGALCAHTRTADTQHRGPSHAHEHGDLRGTAAPGERATMQGKWEARRTAAAGAAAAVGAVAADVAAAAFAGAPPTCGQIAPLSAGFSCPVCRCNVVGAGALPGAGAERPQASAMDNVPRTR